MLYRKIQARIAEYLKSPSNKVLIVTGARQVGKTFIIEHLGRMMFPNFVSLNLAEDFNRKKIFQEVRSTDDFYLAITARLKAVTSTPQNTLVFLDEIQNYPHLITLLKFLKQDNKYTYIASGSLLGVTLAQTSSIPIGSIELLEMFPLDFEEFLLANGFGPTAIEEIYKRFQLQESLPKPLHLQVMDLFKKYLLVGGLPDAVNTFLREKHTAKIRLIQHDVHLLYANDAGKYDQERRLHIKRIFEMIPSNLENKKKRVILQEIEHKKGKYFADYQEEFDYLVSAGVALEVKSIANPIFPLIQSSRKNFLKLYLNDVGILTGILYQNNISVLLEDNGRINLGAIYESLVAQELKAHGFNLYYYDNRKKGEVDFLIDDFQALAVLPIEVKSGKSYTSHAALHNFIKAYSIKKAIVFSSEHQVKIDGPICYLPIYYVMCLKPFTDEKSLLL